MYYMNNDFFDSFSVLFSKEESILNEKRRPLGSYAADALDMDLSLLEEIRDRVALFQEVLTVFLSARDASSAAEAQQALNELWTRLEQAQPLDRLPIVAFTSAAADPVLRPYLESGQLRGLVSGFDGAWAYAQQSGLPLSAANQARLDSQLTRQT